MASSISYFRPSSLFKNIKWRRLQYRKNSSALVQTVEEEENEVQYPPIKPKYPPGGWGEIDRNAAWILHEQGEKMKNMSTLKERADYLATKDSKYGSHSWKYKSLQKNINLSEYQQDKTKTVCLEGIPDIIKNTNFNIDADSNFKLIKDAFVDKILEESDILYHERHHNKYMYAEQDEKLDTKLIQSIVLEVMTLLSHKYEHLLNSQLDQDVNLAAYWERYGVRDFRPKPPEKKKDYGIPFTLKYNLNYSKYQGEGKVSCQIRSAYPLPEFLSMDDNVCTDTPYPECRFWPGVIGSSHDWIKPKSDPGYLAQDPNQFVSVSFIPRHHKLMTELKNKFDDKSIADLVKHHGMNTAFMSTVGQAYNQGFSNYVDITYPFTTQTVMTDGRLFSFYYYQLNTLHLWKDDVGNPLRNVCYIQDSLPLYDIIENNELKGFNDDTFKSLMSCFLLKPVDRGYNMRPTIPSDSPDATAPEEYIPKFVKEEIIQEEIIYDQT